MTQFGTPSSASSPAYHRIIAAGERFAGKERAIAIAAAVETKRQIDGAAAFKAEARRWRLYQRWEEAFRRTKNPMRESQPTMREIVLETARKYGMQPMDLKRRHRSHKIVHPRQEAMWRCRNETSHSYPEIGRYFGLDHTTVMSGVERHEKRMKSASTQTATTDLVGKMFFVDRRDTADIASTTGIPEAEVYNAIAAYREKRLLTPTPDAVV